MPGLDDFQDGLIETGMWVRPTQDLLTGTSKPRMRVDVAQTGFFEKREFRTFREFESATTSTYVIQIVVPVNVILFEFQLQTEAGTARVETLVAGPGLTVGGTFSETLPIIPTNGMTETPNPAYVSQVVITAGGTLTGTGTPGTTLRDVSRVKVADNSNFASTVGADGGAERGVGPNTFYWRFTFTGFIGVVKARWEERP